MSCLEVTPCQSDTENVIQIVIPILVFSSSRSMEKKNRSHLLVQNNILSLVLREQEGMRLALATG